MEAGEEIKGSEVNGQPSECLMEYDERGTQNSLIAVRDQCEGGKSTALMYTIKSFRKLSDRAKLNERSSLIIVVSRI